MNHLKRTSVFIGLLIAICVAIHPQTATSQSLSELKKSELWSEFNSNDGQSNIRQSGRGKKREIISNYDSLWETKAGPKLLLEWLGGRISNFTYERTQSSVKGESATSSTSLKDRDGTRVYLTVVIPMPTYRDMAKLRTLPSINRFRPPALDVVAQQKIKIRGIDSDYFRIRDGSCSVLIPIEQQGVINLFVEKCTDSHAMLDLANALDIERLNLKLTS
jgi:hypothetical protein